MTDKIDDILRHIGEIKTTLAVHRTQTDTMKETLTHIDHTIHGNGKEGLVTSHEKLKQRVTLIWGILTLLGATVATFITKSLFA